MSEKNNSIKEKTKIEEILADEKQITDAMQRAIREAVLEHKRAGNSVAVWKDGKAILIKAEDIEIF